MAWSLIFKIKLVLLKKTAKEQNTNRLTKYFSPGPGAPFKLCKRQLERKSVTSRYYGSTISG